MDVFYLLIDKKYMQSYGLGMDKSVKPTIRREIEITFINKVMRREIWPVRN